MATFVTTLTTVIWTLAIIGALVCPAVLFYWLFIRLRALFKGLEQMGDRLSAVGQQEPAKLPKRVVYFAGPTQNEQTILQARAGRQDINLTRQLAKRRRLGTAMGRWRALGLLWGKPDLQC